MRQAPDRVCQSEEVLAVRVSGLVAAAAAAEADAAAGWRRGLVERVRGGFVPLLLGVGV